MADESFFQPPIGPAHTSGGSWNDSRIATVASPRVAVPKWPSFSAPVNRTVSRPVAGSIEARPYPPSTGPAKRSSPAERQARLAADQRMPGVRLRGEPPPREAGTSHTSPPLEPSSLMIPWITAIVRPSGEKRGHAIWRGGFQIESAFPVAGSTR